MNGIVEVRGGRLRGVERHGIWSFSGVPYAAPPVGPLRWHPPVEPQPWAGIRECDHFGPIAPQTPPIPGMSIGGAPDEQSEDCLTLNIWTQGFGGEPRPVMVWIHGGGFNSGTGAGDLYRGGTLAREGDVVVVTINYRLGALGFLAHPALQLRSSPWAGGYEWSGCGNWGIADQIAALAWVRDNIAAFGGDRGNVTIFGESAGGMSVSALLGMPAARGLYHRAIVESGPPFTHTADEAARRAEVVAERLGVPMTRQALEQVPPHELVRVGQEIGQSLALGDGGLPLPFLPAVDGGLLTRPPEIEVADGASSDVPLLIGSNRDEAAFFAVALPAVNALDEAGLLRWVQRVVPLAESAEALIDRYRTARASRGRGPGRATCGWPSPATSSSGRHRFYWPTATPWPAWVRAAGRRARTGRPPTGTPSTPPMPVPVPGDPGEPAPMCTCSRGRRRHSVACWARATRWRSRSSSVR